MSNYLFVFGSLFSNKFHTANMIWVDDPRLSTFSAILIAVPISWQQYKGFSSNVSLACDKTDNKDWLPLGTDWPIVALKDTKCALLISYLLNKILGKINTGRFYNYIKRYNAEMNEHFKKSVVLQFIKKNLMLILIIISVVVVFWSIFIEWFLWPLQWVKYFIYIIYFKFHHDISEVDIIIIMFFFRWKTSYLNYLARNYHRCVLYPGVYVTSKLLVTLLYCFKNNKF